MNTEIEKVVFICEGGIGKNIAATAVVRNIKKKYSDQELVVVAGYPEVFLYNPHVSKVYAFNNPLYFYQDQIADKKTLILKTEPYLHYDYLQKTRHLIDVWCEQCGVEMDHCQPELFFTKNETSIASAFVKGNKEPIIMQITGGKIPEKDDLESKALAESQMYRRNLPESVAQEVVYQLVEKHRILQVKGNTQYGLKGVEYITTNLRAILVLAKVVKKFICIDSFMMHAAAAFNDKKVVVCWGGTNPSALGYEKHINLTKKVCPTPFCHRPNDFLFDILPTCKWDCPYGEPCLDHDPNEIVKSLLE